MGRRHSVPLALPCYPASIRCHLTLFPSWEGVTMNRRGSLTQLFVVVGRNPSLVLPWEGATPRRCCYL